MMYSVKNSHTNSVRFTFFYKLVFMQDPVARSSCVQYRFLLI